MFNTMTPSQTLAAVAGSLRRLSTLSPGVELDSIEQAGVASARSIAKLLGRELDARDTRAATFRERVGVARRAAEQDDSSAWGRLARQVETAVTGPEIADATARLLEQVRSDPSPAAAQMLEAVRAAMREDSAAEMRTLRGHRDTDTSPSSPSAPGGQ